MHDIDFKQSQSLTSTHNARSGRIHTYADVFEAFQDTYFHFRANLIAEELGIDTSHEV